jgi:hypothetical protein
MMETKLLDSALQYAEEGFSVIPVTPGEKAPPLIDWQIYQDAPADAAQIREWWAQTPTANIAIVTGRISGVTVLDFDGDKGRNSFRDSLERRLPLTRVHKTPRGAHMLFQYRADLKQTVALLPGVDVRNDGVATSSRRPQLYKVRPTESGVTETWQSSRRCPRPSTATSQSPRIPRPPETRLVGCLPP